MVHGNLLKSRKHTEKSIHLIINKIYGAQYMYIQNTHTYTHTHI